MAITPLQLVLSILPGLLICLYIYTRDEHDREPHSHLIISFILGCVVVVPAIQLEVVGQAAGYGISADPVNTAIFSWVVVAGSQELVKLVPLMLFAYPRRAFDEPMDGIVYTVMIGMGFATVENILYAYEYGIGTTIVRAFTAVPAHGVFAVVMGYFVGRAKFDAESRILLILQGFLMAVLLHGAYDFFLFQENIPMLGFVSFIGLVISVVYARRLIRMHVSDSPHKMLHAAEEEYKWR